MIYYQSQTGLSDVAKYPEFERIWVVVRRINMLKRTFFYCIASLVVIAVAVPCYGGVVMTDHGTADTNVPGTPIIQTYESGSSAGKLADVVNGGPDRTQESFSTDNGGGQSFIPEENFLLTGISVLLYAWGPEPKALEVHLWDVTGGAELPGSYTPAYQGPNPGYDYFSPELQFVWDGGDDTDHFVELTFSEFDQVALRTGHVYAFELWPAEKASYQTYWVRGGGSEIPVFNGNGYTMYGGALITDPTNYRPQCSGIHTCYVFAAYGETYDGKANTPTPRDYDIRVSIPVTLVWVPGDGEDPNTHNLYFGTSFDDVNTATTPTVVVGANSYDSSNIMQLQNEATYYWRVDEVNINDANIITKGDVWQFSTSGKAYGPVPESGTVATFYIDDLSLSWQPVEPNHVIYFGTDPNEVNDANTSDTTGIYRGPQQSETKYMLNSLVPDYSLVAGQTYYWRVDEVDDGNTQTGDVWNFTMPDHLVVDDFERYIDANDFNQSWKTGMQLTCDAGTYKVAGTAQINLGTMRFSYENNSPLSTYYLFSEAQYDCNDGSGLCDWTPDALLADDVKALSIPFTGSFVNDTDPTLDRMYMLVIDNIGSYKMVLHPDPNAQVRPYAQEWNIALSELASSPNNVDLNNVDILGIGSGVRCNYYTTGGGTGTVVFDDIRLYPKRCVPEYGPTADFTGDCYVDINDLDYFTNDWLITDANLVYPNAVAPSSPVVWFKFELPTGNLDTAHNEIPGVGIDANGTVLNRQDYTWLVDGGRDGNGCIYFYQPDESAVEVSPNTLDFLKTKPGVTFSLWVNLDIVNWNAEGWPGPFGLQGQGSPWGEGDVVEVKCPTPDPPSTLWIIWSEDGNDFQTGTGTEEYADYGGRWNHYAFTFNGDTKTIEMWHDGQIVGAPLTDGNMPSHLTVPEAFYIGARQLYWAHWAGAIDDFQVYDYALSGDEIAWIATDGTGQRYVPLDAPTDLIPSNRVNFEDYSVLVDQWLDPPKWWPN